MRSGRFFAIVMFGALAVAAACDDAPDSTNDPLDPSGTSSLTIALAASSGSGTANTARFAVDGNDGVGGNLPIDAVDALPVTVTRVEVRPADGGPWIELTVEEGGAIDLLELPTDPEADPIVLARDELDPGTFTGVRLFVDNPEIELSRQVCIGDPGDDPDASAAMADGPPCLEAGLHDVFIPSEDQTGIKTDADFTIEEGDEGMTVLVVFAPEATLRNVTFAPGRGVVVAPVLRTQVDDGMEESGDF